MEGAIVKAYLSNQFTDLEFDEQRHLYAVRGLSLRSVSSVVDLFHNQFDANEQALIYGKKRGFSTDEVLDAWKGEGTLAKDNGHRVHAFAEQYVKWRYFGDPVKPHLTCKQCLGVVEFWNDLPSRFVPVALEYRMYREEFRMAGTADVIILDLLTGKLLIFDYKTNEELFNDWERENIKYIQTKIPQDSFGCYTVQLNLYELMLEQTGYAVGGRVIIHLKQQQDKKLYATYQCKNITGELKPYL